METQRDNLQAALSLAEKGIVAIPCHPGTKIPAVKWKEYQMRMPSEDEFRRLFADPRANIGIITTGMVIFDCDDPAQVDVVLAHCGDTPYRVKTPHGQHLGYAARKGVKVGNHVDIRGMDIDIRAENGLALIPHSETDEGRYEWLAEGLDAIAGLADLPKAKIGWTRERQRRRIRSAITPEHCEPGTILYRGRRYVDHFEPAVSGQNGHTACFVAALKIVSFARKLGGTDADAWALLNYFNATKCESEWSEKELLHKWQDALLKAK